MKTVKLKHLYLSIIICVFVLNFLMSVSTAKTISGIQRLEKGIASYESGNYLNAVINLEVALTELSDNDKENLWDAHLYLGLSYLLLGDTDGSRKEFIMVQKILKNKIPDVHMHSPKITKLFKEVLRLKQEGIWKDSTTGMTFVFVKGGCYEMGDTFGDGDDDEKPVHEVCLDDFYIGKYEVTVDEFRNL